MDLFRNHVDSQTRRLDKGHKRDSEFKSFVEKEMNTNSGRFFGYSDEAVLKVLKEEFSIYKHATPSKKGETEAKKSRIPSYKSISHALNTGDYGLVFTTPQSDRIYVVTKGTWGQKSKSKVVKGFPLSTSMDKIKTFAKRTKVKHGGTSSQSLPPEERTPSMRK
jgi:hypothetical protein